MNFFELLIGIVFNPWFLLSALFWVIVAILAYLLKDKKEAVLVFFPLLALFKTKKLNNFIKKVSKKNPRFWRIFWSIGIFVSFAFTIFPLFFFFINLINLIINPRIENAVTPLIPGVTVSLPLFMYLILPILFVMTTHEFAHGIAASVDGVEVKSTGILGAGFFYLIGMGAFVEVNERELNSSKYHRNTRLRIASAGTFVNALTAGIAFLLLLNFATLISPFYGAQVNQVDTVLTESQGGFNEDQLQSGDIIVALKKKGSSKDFINIDGNNGRSLSAILNNDTKDIEVSVGDELTLKIAKKKTSKYFEKDIILGPYFNIGILYEYPSNSELKITHVLTKADGGNNYDKHIKENTIFTKINGTYIDVKNGKTLEKILTNFNLTEIKLTTASGKNYYLDAEIDGVRIGILTKLYWIPKNEFAKLLGGDFPDFILRELLWLWIIAFSVTIFNMLPLPVFDGDRVVKELVNSGIGENYNKTRKKKEKLYYKKGEKKYGLSEYRVVKIDSVRIFTNQRDNKRMKVNSRSEILLNQNKYNLIDEIGDGFKSTLSLDFSDQVALKDNSLIEVTYEYWFDENRKKKRFLVNLIRVITLIIVAGNFLLSFIKLGAVTFWI
jgi:membrane-associated protease RseP (regulator of RpoE activity)